jgi:hypothetical protein
MSCYQRHTITFNVYIDESRSFTSHISISSLIIDGRPKVGRVSFSIANLGPLASASSQLTHVHFVGAILSHYIDLSYNIRAQIISYVVEENSLSQRARKVISS